MLQYDGVKGKLHLVEAFWLIDCWADDEIKADLSGTHRNWHVYEGKLLEIS
jgi:hypothetical protein